MDVYAAFQAETLVTNGAECSNDLGIDWALLRERADDEPYDEELTAEFFASCLPCHAASPGCR